MIPENVTAYLLYNRINNEKNNQPDILGELSTLEFMLGILSFFQLWSIFIPRFWPGGVAARPPVLFQREFSPPTLDALERRVTLSKYFAR